MEQQRLVMCAEREEVGVLLEEQLSTGQQRAEQVVDGGDLEAQLNRQCVLLAGEPTGGCESTVFVEAVHEIGEQIPLLDAQRRLICA